jgi:hypothetical protein
MPEGEKMGLFDKIFKKPKTQMGDGFFETFTAYTPIFSSWNGQLYESDLVRAAIDARARHCAMLTLKTEGTARKPLQRRLKAAPNEFMSWYKFLYRVSTILDVQSTALIVPILGELGEIQGIYPILPSLTTLVEDENGNPWIRYRFMSGQIAALPLEETGILTRFQYIDDFFGTPNTALKETMELIGLQNQGIAEAVKNSNTFRFMARVNNFSFAEDLKKERQRFDRENFSSESKGGGLLLFPNTYEDVKQINYQAYAIDPKERELINTNVFNYYGVNEEILQNKANGDAWEAFHDGATKPFAIQCSDELTKMCFSYTERINGNRMTLGTNRTQYMSNKDKLTMISGFMDRGIYSVNEARAVMDLEPVEGGDVRVMRGEYKNGNEVDNSQNTTQEGGDNGGDPGKS